MLTPSRAVVVVLLNVVLAACGSGGGDQNDATSSSTPPARGELLASTLVASYSVSDLLALLASNDAAKLLIPLAYTPQCAVDVYHIEYETVGGASEPTTASAALMVSTGSGSTCSGARPILLYAHGTNTDKAFDIAELNDSNAEGVLLAGIFASAGYIVVAPNYAGYDTSTLSYHPYLNAAQQSNDMIDALSAARAALPEISAAASDGGKLFITGYSQGGYVAMATHRALQAGGSTVTGSAPMSGPYALAAFGDAVFYGQVPSGSTTNLTLLVASYQHAYNNVYTTANDLFEPQFAPDIAALLPSTLPISDLYAEGKLPDSEVFSSSPPSPAWAAYTPPTTPALLASIYAAGFGSDNLILNSYRLAYLEDATAAPDGGFPSLTTGVPAASPDNSLRQDLKLNDLRNWAPNAPMLLCGGDEDPTVFFFDTQLMQDYWGAHRPAATVSVLDLEASPSAPYAAIQGGFAAAKAIVESSGGETQVLADYHAGLVAPFCVAAVRSFFDGM